LLYINLKAGRPPANSFLKKGWYEEGKENMRFSRKGKENAIYMERKVPHGSERTLSLFMSGRGGQEKSQTKSSGDWRDFKSKGRRIRQHCQSGGSRSQPFGRSQRRKEGPSASIGKE